MLEAFARAHYHVGAFGAGSKMKFVANLLVDVVYSFLNPRNEETAQQGDI